MQVGAVVLDVAIKCTGLAWFCKWKLVCWLTARWHHFVLSVWSI